MREVPPALYRESAQAEVPVNGDLHTVCSEKRTSWKALESRERALVSVEVWASPRCMGDAASHVCTQESLQL